MPDCRAKMSHGDDVATVTKVGTTSKGEDAVSGGGPFEQYRVLALQCDFPGVTKGEVVTVDDSTHIVTSARTDPTASSLVVGLSGAMVKVPCAFYGARRSAADVRQIAFTIPSLITLGTEQSTFADAYAPASSETYYLVVSADEWPDETPPAVGDKLEFFLDGKAVTAKAANIERHRGYYTITARSR